MSNDGGRTTSYSCFCTASSDGFSNIIATAVAKNCGQLSAEVASATQVFDAYCQLGKADEATDVSGPTSTTGGSIPTSSPASSTAEPSSGLSTGAVIAVSTCVSLVTIAIFTTAYLLWRRRRANRKPPSVEAHAEVFVENGERKGAQGNDGTVENFKAELDARNEINELPTPPPDHARAPMRAVMVVIENRAKLINYNQSFPLFTLDIVQTSELRKSTGHASTEVRRKPDCNAHAMMREIAPSSGSLLTHQTDSRTSSDEPTTNLGSRCKIRRRQ
ncbi:hypothetical protein CGCA056_v005778 [Colletotrichum aenigma]|uniref:uncharacterized protein n=1 Tax=Colletotrichum aenigma TaxID=1215731 RepID=UPI0018731416|nr:uncharacterized protein CGCA056_v005778 [Colletotrichum aenigma]KAF5523398.1 hypothetical protein CGCA056_v005778 [Colletotrichum aenigma]